MQRTKIDATSKSDRPTVSSVQALATEISNRATSGRCLVAIAGAPGSGKSTVSALLQTELKERHDLLTQIVPMDGFHFDNEILHRRDLLARKGAPQTFDVHGLENILMRLTAAPAVDVPVPVFDRELDLSRGSAREITGDTQVILVEGNYLLLDAPPWNVLKQYFGATVMIQCDEPVLRQRLMNRWLDLELSEEAARIKVEANDLPNAVTVMTQSLEADINYLGEG